MSVDANGVGRSDRSAKARCGICDRPAGAPDGRFLACYATDGAGVPSTAAPDGILPLCGACSTAVRELTAAWTPVERPPVGDAASIAGSYAAVAGDCCFCDETIGDDAVLGVESWAAGTAAAIDDVDHYALCETCVSIFAEFLAGVRADC